MGTTQRVTKKQMAQELFEQGLRVETIANLLRVQPAYIVRALIDAGHEPAYVDLYTPSACENRYSDVLAGVLRFKDVDAARESVAQIDRIYHEFEAQRDRGGMHQAQLVALTGKNRAEGIGKRAEARIFADWLIEHLRVEEEPERAAKSVSEPDVPTPPPVSEPRERPVRQRLLPSAA
jgi:hypothetical protein